MFRESWIGGTGIERMDSRLNRLHADLSGLPPIMIYAGSDETLADDSLEFAERDRNFGVNVNLRCLTHGQHSLIFAASRAPEVDVAIGEMALWLRSKLHLEATAHADSLRVRTYRNREGRNDPAN